MSVNTIHGAAKDPADGPGPVVTIGNFDGVHRGHQWLLGLLVERARALQVPAVVYTFDPAPRDVLRPDNSVPRIQNLEDRVKALGEAGVDTVVIEKFTHELASIEARDFAVQILGNQLRASELVLGWDFRFGARRAGVVADLPGWLDIPVDQVSAHRVSENIVSSSHIRQLVRDGQVAQAAALLTRPHRLRGTVQSGDQRGRTLGFPTANLAIDTALRPAPGVYAVLTHVGDQVVPSVANFGRRPTFGGGAEVLEVHLLDWEGDLYGRPLAVDFIGRIRAEVTFEGLDALKKQITADVQSARRILAV